MSEVEINILEEPMAGYGIFATETMQIRDHHFEEVDLLDKGISGRSAEKVRLAYGFTQQQMCDILDLNPKTLRTRIASGKMDTLQGSLILALVDLYNRGISLLGKSHFLEWLDFPSAALGRHPIELLGSYQGIDLVRSELDSIADGSFA